MTSSLPDKLDLVLICFMMTCEEDSVGYKRAVKENGAEDKLGVTKKKMKEEM